MHFDHVFFDGVLQHFVTNFFSLFFFGEKLFLRACVPARQETADTNTRINCTRPNEYQILIILISKVIHGVQHTAGGWEFRELEMSENEKKQALYNLCAKFGSANGSSKPIQARRHFSEAWADFPTQKQAEKELGITCSRIRKALRTLGFSK